MTLMVTLFLLLKQHVGRTTELQQGWQDANVSHESCCYLEIHRVFEVPFETSQVFPLLNLWIILDFFTLLSTVKSRVQRSLFFPPADVTSVKAKLC